MKRRRGRRKEKSGEGEEGMGKRRGGVLEGEEWGMEKERLSDPTNQNILRENAFSAFSLMGLVGSGGLYFGRGELDFFGGEAVGFYENQGVGKL